MSSNVSLHHPCASPSCGHDIKRPRSGWDPAGSWLLSLCEDAMMYWSKTSNSLVWSDPESNKTLKLWFLNSKQSRKNILNERRKDVERFWRFFHCFFFAHFHSGHPIWFFSHRRAKRWIKKTLNWLHEMYQSLALSVYVWTGCTIHSTNPHFWVFIAQQVQQTGGVLAGVKGCRMACCGFRDHTNKSPIHPVPHQ